MSLRPTPSEERWLTLARRLRRRPEEHPFSEHTGGWRTANLLSRCTLFALGLVAAVMTWVIAVQLWPNRGLLVAGIISIAAAEWLILARRQFWSGIEEGLEVAGLTMLAFAPLSHGSWPGETVGARLVCAAWAIAALRLLNPVFSTLAPLALVLALDAPPAGSSLACYGIGIAALVAGGYRFQRPSYDRTLDWLVVVMPFAGYLWSAGRSATIDYWHAGVSAWLVPVCPLAFAALALGTGLRRHAHAPLISLMLCVACTAYELRRLTGLPLEIRLIVWGTVLLILSIVLERYLREPRGGITSRKVRDGGDLDRILGIAGSAVLTPASGPKTAAAFEGAGGRFGGGGATGQY